MSYNTINYSVYYYQLNNFKYIDVPWTIAENISKLTKPIDREEFYVKDKVLVGSGEQSFLELISNDKLNHGQYVTMTPCFRDETILDEIHKQYFMKTELIVYDEFDKLTEIFPNIILLCLNFFNQYVEAEIIETIENNNIGTRTYDIIDKKTKIELGSYGIRTTTLGNKSVSWIYATGCAEPRLSYVVNIHKKSGYHTSIIHKSNVGSFTKILEEVDELKDAHLNNNKIMELVELSDLLGSIELYLKHNYPEITLDDLNVMNKVTQRAFTSGRR